MAGTFGFFLKGMSSGVQSGFEMGWKKKQKKELEAQQKKIVEEGAILNSAAADMMEDKVITDDEMVQWNALLLASGKEVQEMSKGWNDAIRNMNAKGCELYKQKFEMISENIASFDPANFSQSYEEAIKYYPSQKIYFDTANNIIKKKHEAVQSQPEDVWGQAGTLPQDIRPEYLRSKGVDIPQATVAPAKLTDTQVKLAEIDKLTFLSEERRNQMKVDMLSKSDSATAEKVKAIKAAGGDNADVLEALGAGVQGVNPPKTGTTTTPETVSTLKNWESMFDITAKDGPKTEDEYNRALELLAQSKDNYKPKYPTWKEALIAEIKGIAKDLEGITDRKDRTILLDVYKQKLEEIATKYPEVDLTQFPEPEGLSGWDKFLNKIGF